MDSFRLWGRLFQMVTARDNDNDNARAVLNQYIKHYENKVKMMKGSGLKKRGGNIVFFNDVKQLLKKLELIVGEILAGNTSIEMRNTGVAILDMLLKTSKIKLNMKNCIRHISKFKIIQLYNIWNEK